MVRLHLRQIERNTYENKQYDGAKDDCDEFGGAGAGFVDDDDGVKTLTNVESYL